MKPLRLRLTHDTIAWKVAWTAYETSSKARQWYRTRQYRIERALDRVKPFACISGGTDCDGMRYAGVSFHWTRSDAALAEEAVYYDAECPCGARIVSGREGREWQADYESDTRDRFAEIMNY